MKARSRTDFIVVHCAATPPSLDVGAKEIRSWHKKRGWIDIGYHYVDRRNGEIEPGRDEHLPGAHVRNYNSRSVGICLVGGVSESDRKVAENNFTAEQLESLHALLRDLKKRYPDAEILGHRDFPKVAKECPSFDVRDWLAEHPLDRPYMVEEPAEEAEPEIIEDVSVPEEPSVVEDSEPQQESSKDRGRARETRRRDFHRRRRD